MSCTPRWYGFPGIYLNKGPQAPMCGWKPSGASTRQCHVNVSIDICTTSQLMSPTLNLQPHTFFFIVPPETFLLFSSTFYTSFCVKVLGHSFFGNLFIYFYFLLSVIGVVYLLFVLNVPFPMPRVPILCP